MGGKIAKGWLGGEPLRDGEPCSHRGCLSHISHPCEGCGRIGGRSQPTDAPLMGVEEFDVVFDRALDAYEEAGRLDAAFDGAALIEKRGVVRAAYHRAISEVERVTGERETYRRAWNRSDAEVERVTKERLTPEEADRVLKIFANAGITPEPLEKQTEGTLFWKLLTLAPAYKRDRKLCANCGHTHVGLQYGAMSRIDRCQSPSGCDCKRFTGAVREDAAIREDAEPDASANVTPTSSVQPPADYDCECGHPKAWHIYEEGACRGGSVCGADCTKYAPTRVKPAPADEQEFENALSQFHIAAHACGYSQHNKVPLPECPAAYKAVMRIYRQRGER